VVSGDELLDPRPLTSAEYRRHIVQLPGQRQGRGGDVHGRMAAAAAPGVRVGEQHHPQDGHGATAASEELLEQIGWLVQLQARRPPAAIPEAAARDEVAEAVEPLEPPGVAVAVHGRVEVLALDRDQSRRPEEQVVDLAAAVAVAANQDPVVAEHPAELADDLLLAGYPGGQLLFGGGGGQHRLRRRRWRETPQPPDRNRGAQPGDPVLLGAGAIARVRGAPQE